MRRLGAQRKQRDARSAAFGGRGEAWCIHLFFPHLDDLHAAKVGDAESTVLITARSRAALAACHRCGLWFARVHSRYRRRLHDLAAGGRAVTISLEARRFFCGNPACELRTFSEQVPALALLHQRRTPLPRSLLEAVGLALAGRAGARLARALGIAVSRTTLTRLIPDLPDPVIGQVTVLGVDLSDPVVIPTEMPGRLTYVAQEKPGAGLAVGGGSSAAGHAGPGAGRLLACRVWPGGCDLLVGVGRCWGQG